MIPARILTPKGLAYSMNRSKLSKVVDGLSLDKLGPGLHLLLELDELRLQRLGLWGDDGPGAELQRPRPGRFRPGPSPSPGSDHGGQELARVQVEDPLAPLLSPTTTASPREAEHRLDAPAGRETGGLPGGPAGCDRGTSSGGWAPRPSP